MKKTRRVGRFLTVASMLGMLLGGVPMQDSMANQESPTLFDVIYLKEGKQVDEAIAYFDAVAAIAKEHGLVRLKTYAVTKNIRGIIPQPAVINIWRMDQPDAMQKMGADPAYQEWVPTRDALFDMSQVSLIMAQEA